MDHTSCRLRLAAIADAPAILEIYAQYMDTPITFETELPSLEEFEGRIRAITAEYPWIVCEDETGRIIGYAYGHKQLERAAYRWNAELSEYLDSRVTSKGIGKRMLLVLLELLKAQKKALLSKLNKELRKGADESETLRQLEALQSGDKSECEERCDA
jgi:L-amino acid N-acyltransferase YncA